MEKFCIARGTTPTLTFKFQNGTNLSAADEIWVTIKHPNGKMTISKDQLTVGDNTIILDLTQEQTLLLRGNSKVKIQIRFLANGAAYATRFVEVGTMDVLDNRVIDDE